MADDKKNIPDAGKIDNPPELGKVEQAAPPVQAIRPGKEQEAENRAQEVYGEKYNPLLMFDSKKAVSRMLHEDIERQAVRRMMRQAHKEQQTFQKKKSEQER